MTEPDKRTFYIYCHKSPDGRRYIGQTCAERPERRWGKGYRGCTHFERAINKYGWDNFEHSILVTCCNQEMANRVEAKLIELYDTTNPEHGYNIVPGGRSSSGYTRSDDTKAKISKSLTGRKGHKPTEEQLKHMSEAQKRVYRDGTRTVSPEGSEAIRKALIQNSESRRRPVIQFELDGTKVAEYPSIAAAVRATGFHQSGIVLTCQQKHKKASGFVWRYADRPETFPEIQGSQI